MDAQITFDPLMRPVSTNGITTVVFGNCGCGFAPCVPEDRSFLIEIMDSGATDIILVPTSKNIDQLSMAEEVVSQLT